MMLPFVSCAVEHRHPTDTQLADACGEGSLGTDGAEEGRPSGGYGG